MLFIITTTKVVEQCHVAASEYGKHIQRLADSPLRGQYKGVLMAWCGKAMTMLNYVIRACATTHTATAAIESDDHFFDALAAARGVSAELLRRHDVQDPWARRERMQLALRRGGAGAASLHRNRPAAYLGSLADTFPTLAALPRLAPLLNAPHTWHTSRRRPALPYATPPPRGTTSPAFETPTTPRTCSGCATPTLTSPTGSCLPGSAGSKPWISSPTSPRQAWSTSARRPDASSSARCRTC